MNAVILAGGSGSRLRPLTNDIPKPMLTAASHPIIDYSVAQLYHYGVRDMIFTLGYLPEQVVEWAIGYTGIHAHFCIEESPLGTLGSVKAAADYLDDIFIVLSGDGISNIDLNAMLDRHVKSGAEFTAAVMKCADPQLYGVAVLDQGGFIRQFVEKPHGITNEAYINCGVYIVNKRILNMVSAQNCDFAKDLFPLLVAENKLAYHVHEGYWRDVGDLKSYYECNFEMLDGGFFPFVRNFNGAEYSARLVGGLTPSLVADSADISGEVNNCIIGRGVKIAAGSVLNDCVIADNSVISGTHSKELLCAGRSVL